MSETEESIVSTQLTLVWSLLIVVTVLAFFLQRHRVHFCPPSSAAMILGMVTGAGARLIFKQTTPLRFSPSIFFYGLLPPIVFAAGFNLKKRHFFRNLGSILLFAILGTIVSTLVFGLLTLLLMKIRLVDPTNLGDDPLVVSLLYGALISSIDPVATLSVFADVEVPSLLYNLVFGESVMNDAVAIVLFNTFAEFYQTPWSPATIPLMVWRFIFIFIGSLVLGVVLALPCAFILKRFQLSSMGGGPSFDGAMYEITILFMAAYLSYLISEALGMSGIVSLFMSGICHAHYSFYNICEESQVTVKKSLEAIAFMAETFLFAYLGLQVLTFNHIVDWGLLVSGIPLCLLSRAANIFPLARLANLGRQVKVPFNLQCMQWAVGLRGAVAYALVVHMPTLKNGREREGNPAIETATLFIVCSSTLLLGGGTVKLLHYFRLDAESIRNDPAAVELSEITGQQPSAAHRKWKRADRQYLKPIFGGRNMQSSSNALLTHMDSTNSGGGSFSRPASPFADEEHDNAHGAYQTLVGDSAGPQTTRGGASI